MRALPDVGRPNRPDASLLKSAATSLQELLELEEAPRWTILRREVRKGSTLFRLAAAHPSGPTHAWAKTDVPSASSAKRDRVDQQLVRFRDSLAFEEQVSPLLALELAARDVRFDRPLAINIEQLSAVRLEVPGRQLGRTLGHSLFGRRASLDTLSQIGAVVRHIEAITKSFGASFDRAQLQRCVEAELERAAPNLDTEMHRRVANRAHELTADIDVSSSAVRGHGDLSPTNILVDSDRLGLIDFSWRRSLAGESVARLVARLSVEPRTPAGWKRSAVAAVLRGYGHDGVDSWRLAYLLRLLRWSRRPSPPLRHWAKEELIMFVGDV